MNADNYCLWGSFLIFLYDVTVLVKKFVKRNKLFFTVRKTNETLTKLFCVVSHFFLFLIVNDFDRLSGVSYFSLIYSLDI